MMKRRIRKSKDVDDFNKPGRDIREIFKNYKAAITKTEAKIFLGVPLVISILIFICLAVFEQSNTVLLEYIVEINKVSLNVIAILAGFNTTSLSIIAANNNKTLSNLGNDENEKKEIVRQLVTFFAFAIVIQLIVLILGILFSIISKSFNEISLMLPFLSGMVVKIPLLAFGVIWLTIILFTIIISIRNATLLYRYVIFMAGD